MHAADGSPAESSRQVSGSWHRVGGDHGHLARPVGGKPAHAGACGDQLGHRRRHRGGPPHHVAQGGQVEVLEVGVVGHGQRDRRHGHLQRHAVSSNAAQLVPEVETAVQADGGTGRGRGKQVQEAEDVRGRRRDLESVVVAEAERGAPVRRGQAEGAVGVTNGLGQVGGARAEHERGVVLGPHRGQRRGDVARTVDDRRGAASSRSSTCRAPSSSASRAVPEPSATAHTGAVSRRRCRPRAPSKPD